MSTKTNNLFVTDKSGRTFPDGVFGEWVVKFPYADMSYLKGCKVSGNNLFFTDFYGLIKSDNPQALFYCIADKDILMDYIGKKINDSTLKKLKQYLRHSFEISTKDYYFVNNYHLINCKICNFRHIFPWPTSQFLEDYYSKFVSNPSLRNFNFKYHFFVLKNSIATKHFRGLRVLDVAAGNGSFLSHLKEAGAAVLGFEPSISECDKAKNKGVQLINSVFNINRLDKIKKFDVVIAGNILEHVSDPFNFMGLIKRSLKKGGYVFLQIPNDFNPLQKQYLRQSGLSPWFVCPPEHLNYWTVPEARTFVQRCGFEIIHEEAQFPIEIFLLFGMDYLKHPELGKKAHRMRCNFEDTFQDDMGTLSLIYSKFIEAGIGRDYVAILKLP